MMPEWVVSSIESGHQQLGVRLRTFRPTTSVNPTVGSTADVHGFVRTNR